MITNLPVEIIVTISSYLSIHDKISLITTCHTLNNVISKVNLYSELNVYNVDTANAMIKKFQDKHYEGAQVKTLCIHLNKLESGIFGQLHTIFPNITKVVSYNVEAPVFKDKDTTPMSRWINTIEYYDTSTDWEDVWYWLERQTFPHLTELKIVSGYKFQESVGGLDRMYFNPFIKNAPSLRKLELSRCDICLDLVEYIHTHCPHITSLTLKSLILIIEDNAQPQKIIPANTVTELSLNNIMVADGQRFFLKYITNKYPNLRSLTFAMIDFLSEVNDHLPYIEGIICCEQYMDYLKSFIIGLCHYRSNSRNFLKSLPKTLKKLKLNLGTFDDVLESLSLSGLNLTCLELNSDECTDRGFGDEKQTAFLQNLTSLKTLKARFHTPIQHFKDGILSNSITKLVIEFEREDIFNEEERGVKNYDFQYFCIDWILSKFPSLETLDINNSSNCVLGKANKLAVATYPNLRVISIKNSLRTEELVPYLKSCAPNMEELSVDLQLYNCFEEFTQSMDLSGWNSLKKFNLSLIEGDQLVMDRYRCKITIGTTTKIFNFTSNDDEGILLLPTKFSPRFWEKVTKFNIKCDATQDIIIGNFKINKIENELVIC